MKLKILLLFYVLLFCACETSQKAQPNKILNESNFNQPTNVNAIENKQVEIEKPKLVDDSRFSPVKIKRADQRSKFLLNIDVEYPQLKKAKTPQEIKFNQYVKKKLMLNFWISAVILWRDTRKENPKENMRLT